ncbi:hypothetical protein ERS070208_02478 [Streptococcus pneumoniae]|nr:hypothetical protein ERS070043_02611 [Streptococcus pneumoniae]CTK36772.1 hypothetical protein ERS070208_02478 [Streptococcus pneumoniae]VMG18412.1 radical SAM superfamily protein (pseudogene) [Streptococcus pneumoniae]VOQ28210.1 radical SAM superfamily protein (pseudogene) [Streptococcus pneumoniae]VSS04051.1 radical SAM superfamily protein (pseudogene) [Streptococcus pneumoniae]
MSGSSVTKWKLFPNISSSIELQEMRRRGSVQGCKAVKQEFENEKTT